MLSITVLSYFRTTATSSAICLKFLNLVLNFSSSEFGLNRFCIGGGGANKNQLRDHVKSFVPRAQDGGLC